MPYYILLVTVLKQNVKNNTDHLWLPQSYEGDLKRNAHVGNTA